MRYCLILVFLWGIPLFGLHHEHADSKAAGKKDAVLSETEAALRSKQVSDVTYLLDLKFLAGKDSFTGTNSIEFNYTASPAKLRIDYFAGNISKILLNGHPIDYSYNGTFLEVSTDSFKKHNQLVIDFETKYSSDGTGLHRFVDPADSETYLYSDFEPYFANKMIPCFDQPDLKASFETTVSAPKNWELVSTNREDSKNEKGDLRIWRFPKSERISTYVWSLHLGPYQMWEDKTYRIPMRIYARKSFGQYIDTQAWFSLTKKGLDFFEAYFSSKYAFTKYDHVVVPQFNSGAMENVGAVTFSELYFPRGKATEAQKMRLNITILHEMAHMWFGNLVTPQWWDDLWLNESFADYLSFFAQSKVGTAEEERLTWQLYYNRKRYAYDEDDYPTTHNIKGPVENTQVAQTIFDSITYQKGSAAIRQVAYLIGEEAFRDAMRKYMQRYRFANARYADFIAGLQESTKHDLKKWTEQWLLATNYNTLTPTLTCENGKIKSLSISQSTSNGILRSHKINIALLDSEMKLIQNHSLLVEGKATEVKQLVGKPCPAFVYANAGDYSFVKVNFDAKSMQALMKKLSHVEDEHLRLLLWGSLWDMVHDSQLSTQDFLALYPQHLAKEKDEAILAFALPRISTALFFMAQFTPEEKARQAKIRTEMEKWLWNQINVLAPQSFSLAKSALDAFIPLVERESSLLNLVSILDGTVEIPNLKINQDVRWRILQKLSEMNFKNIAERIAKEQAKDTTLSGRNGLLASQAAAPDLANKEKIFNRLLAKTNQDTLSDTRVLAAALFPTSQENLRELFTQRFFQSLEFFAQERPAEFGTVFLYLGPHIWDDKKEVLLNKFLSSHPKLPPSLYKGLIQMAFDARVSQEARLFSSKDI